LQGRLAYLSILIVSVVLGVMMAVQFKSVREPLSFPSRQQEILAFELKQVKQERESLAEQNRQLREQLDRTLSGSSPSTDALLSELTMARAEAGLLGVKGSGVTVILNDSIRDVQPGDDPNQYLIHDKDLLTVVNELRAAGAEAISVNGQRLLATSEIRCAGNTILVNVTKIAPPFIVMAIGDPDMLESSLKIKGGVIEYLQIWGIQVEIKKSPPNKDIIVPGYSGPIPMKFGSPVKGE